MKTAIVTVMIEYAASLLGTPYIYGGNGATGFDCSGLICEILKSVGLSDSIDRSSQGLYNLLSKSKTPRFSQNPEIGDVVFYGKDANKVTHVAMIYDILVDATEKKILIIEAGGGGRHTLSERDAIEAGAAVRIRPLFHRSDVVAIISPFSNVVDYIKL